MGYCVPYAYSYTESMNNKQEKNILVYEREKKKKSNDI